ncbi:MAG: hypothetical protein AABZ44_09700, partial [Elusimicrobiota bacterium]
TADHLEDAYASVTAALGAKPEKKLAFFLYTNHNEFEQNRVVNVGEGTGGVTEAFKDRFLVFNDGSTRWLRHVIFHEFTHEVEFAVLNAGFWKSARLLKSILYPLWIMEGLAEIMSGEIDAPIDRMYANDAATSDSAPPFHIRDLHNFNHLKPNQITRGYKQGASMLEFIRDEYGQDKLGVILKAYRDRFDVDAVLIDVLGLDATRFDRNYNEWLEESYGAAARRQDEPSVYGERLTESKPPIPIFRKSPVTTHDGKSFFYISMREGFPGIYEQDIDSGKVRLRVGRKFGAYDWIAFEDGNLAISGDDRYVYFVGEKNQRDQLYRYDRAKGRLTHKAIEEFEALKSPAVDPQHPDEVAVSVMENGRYDIVIFDYAKGAVVERVTSDPQDDDDVEYLADGSGLLYSTEIAMTTSGVADRDLYLWRRSDRLAQRLSRNPGAERHPSVSADGRKVVFIADGSGQWDIYELDLASGKVARKTRVMTGVFAPSYSGASGDIMFSSYRDGEMDVYRGSAARFLDEDVSADFSALAPPPEHEKTAVGLLKDPVAYKGSFGTDLFFPAFFFSTQGGLFALAYWQGSDFLGYHNMATNFAVNSGYGALEYSTNYSYSRYRTQYGLAFKGAQYRDPTLLSDQGEDLRKVEHAQMGFASYPLDRFNRVETGVTLVERYNYFPQDKFVLTNLQDLHWSLQFVRDTTSAPYLVVTRGSRFFAGFRKAFANGDYDIDYLTKYAEYHQYLPIGTDSTIASRFAVRQSYGTDYEVFPLAGQGGVRGYPRESEADARRSVVVNSLELRVPLFSDVNYHMWYMFPDFYFKNIYLGVFSDQGVRYNGRISDLTRDWKQHKDQDFLHSLGVSLKFNTFILETFPLFVSLEWAKRTATHGSIFYGSIFQYFKF